MAEAPSTSSGLLTKTQKKSDVWKDFTLMLHDNNGQYTGFARCQNCNVQLKHHKLTSGTSHLRRHIEACKKN